MANFNTDNINDKFKETASIECGLYLSSCLSEQELNELKEDWNKAGGHKVIPWWKWCLDNIQVSYSKKEA